MSISVGDQFLNKGAFGAPCLQTTMKQTPGSERDDPAPHHRCRTLGSACTWEGQSQHRPRLINSAATQAHILCFKSAHPNIYSICDLLKCMKGLVLWKHSLRISNNRSNSRILKRSFSEGLVLILYQKPGALNQINKLITINNCR